MGASSRPMLKIRGRDRHWASSQQARTPLSHSVLDEIVRESVLMFQAMRQDLGSRTVNWGKKLMPLQGDRSFYFTSGPTRTRGKVLGGHTRFAYAQFLLR